MTTPPRLPLKTRGGRVVVAKNATVKEYLIVSKMETVGINAKNATVQYERATHWK